MGKPSWGVVMTADEPAQLVIAFVAYHLAIGAAEVHVYLDSPNPEAEAVISALPNVFVTNTDLAYWQATEGRRPGFTTTRQRCNASRACQTCGVDWLLHIDADEFVRGPDTVPNGIAQMPDGRTPVQFGMLERVRLADEPPDTIFDGVFRVPLDNYIDWGADVYGRFAKFLRAGISAHNAGKTMVQTGGDFLLGVHIAKTLDGESVTQFADAGRHIYHFDGLTPLHLILKLALRFNRPKIKGLPHPDGVHRTQQMSFSKNHHDRKRELERMVAGIQMIDAGQVAGLDRVGALVHDRFDPRPQIARMGIEVDLSVAAFDAALRKKHAGLIAEMGLDG